MKTFFRFLAVLAVLFVALSIYIATRPSHFEFNRKKVIEAPTSLLYKTVNDYKTWMEWGKWKELDTTIATSYSKNSSGVGSSISWTSLPYKSGSIKTLSVEENKTINQKIFIDNVGEMDMYWEFLSKKDGATEVTWGMKGDLGFKTKAISLLKGGIEKMLAPLFDASLDGLDTYIHKQMDIHSITPNGVVEYTGGYYIYLSKECSFDDIGKNMDMMLSKVLIYAIQKGYPRAGSPFTMYHKYDEENKIAMFSVCIPVKERVDPEGDIALAFMERGNYYKTTLKGAYKFSDEAWKKAFEFAAKDGVEIDEDGMPFEVYTKGHTTSPNPADWLTEIYLPIK